MMLATHRAALYLRVSLDQTGDGLAVKRQREDCRALAAARGWEVVGEYVDNSVSASKRDVQRPGYERLVADYAAGLFDALVCWDLDRLTRQPRQLEDWIDAAEGRGLALITANGEADLTTDGGRMFARIKAAVARAEIERKGARQTRANAQRAARGGVPKGARCTGYTTDGRQVRSEAATVRAIFRGFAAGDTLRHLSREHDLTPSTVRTILTNPRYAGRRVYKGEVVGTGSWTPIVDGVTFDLVQQRLADPTRKTNLSGSTARKYLGSGLYLCECGDPRPVVSGGDGARYRCQGCGLVRSREAVDAFVLAVLAERLRQPDALEAMRPKADGDRTADLLAEQTATQERLDGLAQLVADGTLTPAAVRDAAQPLRARLEAVQAELAAVSSVPVLDGLEDVADRLEEVWPTLHTDRQRALVRTFLTVTLHRAPRGRKGFDPGTVSMTWTSNA